MPPREVQYIPNDDRTKQRNFVEGLQLYAFTCNWWFWWQGHEIDLTVKQAKDDKAAAHRTVKKTLLSKLESAADIFAVRRVRGLPCAIW